jgi:hypothetical protein
MKKDSTKTMPQALPAGYADWLAALKADIAHARQRAALAVNAEHRADRDRVGRRHGG